MQSLLGQGSSTSYMAGGLQEGKFQGHKKQKLKMS